MPACQAGTAGIMPRMEISGGIGDGLSPAAGQVGPPPSVAELDAALGRLLKAHERWYDVQRDYEFGGVLFPGYAELHARSEHYVLVKRAKLWGANTHEYLFFLTFEHFREEAYAQAIALMKEKGLGKVRPEPEHMTSCLSLVVLAQSVDARIPARVRATRFRKNLMLGFRGWVDLRVAVADLSVREVYVNARAVELRDTLEANVFPNGLNPARAQGSARQGKEASA